VDLPRVVVDDGREAGEVGGGPRPRLPAICAVSRKGNVVARFLSTVTQNAAESFVREMVSHKAACW
jgi:hypothetical protein